MAVQAHPSATEEQLAAISGAIETWDTVLRDCFDDLITLTEVARRQDADIVDCDVDALAFVFAWALEGVEPYPPGEGPYDCSLD